MLYIETVMVNNVVKYTKLRDNDDVLAETDTPGNLDLECIRDRYGEKITLIRPEGTHVVCMVDTDIVTKKVIIN